MEYLDHAIGVGPRPAPSNIAKNANSFVKNKVKSLDMGANLKSISLGALAFVYLSGVANANECVGLWIERNSIFDRAGYCFGSALGKGYFDNSGCHTKNPSLSSSERKRIAAIKSRESALGCAQQKRNWSVATLRNYGARSAPVRQTPTAPSCVTSAEIYFNLSGRWEIAHDLKVSGPWYVSMWESGQQAFLNAGNGKCVGGEYSYRYTAELDDLTENPVKTYTGSFTISNYTKRCEIDINPYSGHSNMYCD